MATFLSGAAFGAGIFAAGLHHPSVVASQLKFENHQFLQAFLTATASSAIIYSAVERLGFVRLQPRGPSPLGFFGRFDGNAIGGALLGAGMTLSGSAPETLLVQVAAGIRSGLFALQGAILGGALWAGPISTAVRNRRQNIVVQGGVTTLNDQVGVSKPIGLAIFELVCAGTVVATNVFSANTTQSKVSGVVGGLLLGAAQLFSVLSRKSMMGISGCYEEAGNIFWWLVNGADSTKKPGHGSIVFGTGLVTGAFGMAYLVPELGGTSTWEPTPLLATLGGVLMAVGSRLAGGCTSGHGISGMSLLSTSSLVTMGSALIAGAAVSLLKL
ncbi:unnamed protein product [Clonostachys rosea f. rosea IK726]|uniref:Uncharacterized protein n=2 Tax=Bionectria ochroleuca TaxID=29856 RepID=A0A0B7JNR3_BIOOC|nr:unnamed protein product [Clonostachys rosea f. rosea IK726]